MQNSNIVDSSLYIDQVYDRLLDAISLGELKPGERVRQTMLAERFGVSRQPISHALQLLKKQGFVRDAGKQGLEVAPLDFRYLTNLYEVRALLEDKAAYLAAERVRTGQASAQLTDGLSEALLFGRRAVQSGASGPELARADYQFHTALYRLSGNSVIEQVMQGQWPHLLRSMLAVIKYGEYGAASLAWEEHSRFAAKILAGDASAASAGCVAHLQRARCELLEGVERFQATATT